MKAIFAKLPYGLKARLAYLAGLFICTIGIGIASQSYIPSKSLNPVDLSNLINLTAIIWSCAFIFSPRLLKVSLALLIPAAVIGIMHLMPEVIAAIPAYAPLIFWSLIALITQFLVIALAFSVTELFMEWGVVRDWFLIGKGGSARFSGSLAFLKYRTWLRRSCAPLYLGLTTHKFDPILWCRRLVVDDENHHVVFGMNGSGKSVSIIWPNLIGMSKPGGLTLSYALLAAVMYFLVAQQGFTTLQAVWTLVLTGTEYTLIACAAWFLIIATILQRYGNFDGWWYWLFATRTEQAYPGSVLVLDPKQEHYERTAFYRRRMGHNVILLAPFNPNSQRFNPLTDIDINDPRAKLRIQSIANGCVVAAQTQNETSQHFAELRQIIICGLIAHVISTEPKCNHTLPFVYDFFLTLGEDDHFDAFIEAMRYNDACGNLPREAALAYDRAGRNERGSIFTTTLRNLTWLSSPKIRWLLSGHDFNLDILRTELTTLYIGLDFDAMHVDKLGRFMRVIINLSIETCLRVDIPKKHAHMRTWFILDEVAQLGRMGIEKHYRTLRASHVKLSSFFQDYGALMEVTSSPSAIMANSTIQAIGIKDTTTAEVAEKHLGMYREKTKNKKEKGGDTVSIQRKSLMDLTELMDTLRQDRNVQIVITGQGDKLFLRRQPLYINVSDNVNEPESKTA